MQGSEQNFRILKVSKLLKLHKMLYTFPINLSIRYLRLSKPRSKLSKYANLFSQLVTTSKAFKKLQGCISYVIQNWVGRFVQSGDISDMAKTSGMIESLFGLVRGWRWHHTAVCNSGTLLYALKRVNTISSCLRLVDIKINLEFPRIICHLIFLGVSIIKRCFCSM